LLSPSARSPPPALAACASVFAFLAFGGMERVSFCRK
jgi:hypothetical protein